MFCTIYDIYIKNKNKKLHAALSTFLKSQKKAIESNTFFFFFFFKLPGNPSSNIPARFVVQTDAHVINVNDRA